MSKLPHVGTTIFTTMSKLALEYNAINLSQGFPNFPVDQKLVEITQSVAAGNNHQYAPMGGNQKLLEGVSQIVRRKYLRDVAPEKNILITAGATQGVFAAIQALVMAGEEVVILDPSYDCYEAPVILTGGRPVRIPLNAEFLPDWEAINNRVSAHTRMVIINNPHNPSGKVWREDDFLELEKLLQRNPHLILLSDEVYEFIYFEHKHISVNTRPKLRDRSVVVSSFGKTFHITGWKVGYLTAPEPYINEIKKVHQFLVFCVNSVAQESLAEYLGVVDFDSLGCFYKDKRDLFRNLMTKSRFKFLPSEGSYFQIASYENISEEPDTEFCKRMVVEYGVAAIPLSVFNADSRDSKLVRFCFAKETKTLRDAAERLCRI